MTQHIKIGAVQPRMEYDLTGSQPRSEFPFDFAVFQPSDVEVRVNGVVTATGFTVALATNGTGSVNFGSPLSPPTRVTLLRRLTIQRQTDFQEGGELRAKTLNDELDFQTASIQQVAHGLTRALRQPDSDPLTLDMQLPPVATRAGHMLGFGVDGGIVARAVVTPATVAFPLPVAQGGTGRSNAADARAALGAESAALNHAYLDEVQAFMRAQRYAPATLVDQGTIAWDLDAQPLARVTLAGNRTMAAPTNQRDGGVFVLIVNQDATGNRALAWNAVFDFGTDGTPSLPSGAGRTAIFQFLSNGTALRCVGRWSN